MSDLHEHSALEIGRFVASGEVSPLEVAEHFLDRIHRLDDLIGAFASVDHERARTQVARLPPQTSPLWGVPTAIKDLEAEAGQRTTLGSAAFEIVPPADSTAVRLLREAGTVSLGRTAAPELGLVSYTEPHGRPPTRTPWDASRSAGGSSGGAAAAVAAGLVPFAQGGDGGGSIRIPASACGLVGLKPSRGRVSGALGADAVGFSCTGVLTRTVADTAAALDVMSVPQPSDLDRPAGGDFLAMHAQPPGRLRIARPASAPGGVVIDPACRAAVDRAETLLTSLGHHVEEIPTPWAEQFREIFVDVWSVAASSVAVPAEKEPLLRPITQYLRERGRSLTGPAAITALMTLCALSQLAVRETAPYDLLLTATLATPPPPIGSIRCDDDPVTELERLVALAPFLGTANASGQPAISLPLHEHVGLPIGVHLIGRPGGEIPLLQVASQLEQLVRWDLRRPPIW